MCIRDRFMTLTLVMVATVYALFDLQPIFILIVFVFVGVIGIVTVALAATYRAMPERQFAWIWCIPVLITAVILGFSIFTHILHGMGISSPIGFTLQGFLKPGSEYQLLFLFLTSLVILLFLSVIKIYRGEES